MFRQLLGTVDWVYSIMAHYFLPWADRLIGHVVSTSLFDDRQHLFTWVGRQG